MSITRRQCFVHAHREAVARCLSCGRSYCRECVTEHAGRLRCAKCLSVEAERRERSLARWRGARVLALASVSLALGLLALVILTRQLGSIPASFHDGSVWSAGK